MANIQIYVHVAPVSDGRQIGWGSDLVDTLQSRAEDIRQAVRTGLSIVGETITADYKASSDWTLSEVTTTFGITLTSEGGVIFAKASAETAFEVTATFRRR